jgi:hypothetical protein
MKAVDGEMSDEPNRRLDFVDLQSVPFRVEAIGPTRGYKEQRKAKGAKRSDLSRWNVGCL